MAAADVAMLLPFHVGELQAQAAALDVSKRHAWGDTLEDIAAVGRRGMREELTEQQGLFFATRTYVFVGGADEAGRPWASIVCGERGQLMQVQSPKHITLRVPASQAGCLHLTPGGHVAVLGIGLDSRQDFRRRNRMSATVASVAADERGLTAQLHVVQTQGACPKYIQGRVMNLPADADGNALRPFSKPQPMAEALGEAQQRIVRNADALFLATMFAEAALLDPATTRSSCLGCDVINRGGPPGFVQVERNGAALRWPEYSGNWLMSSAGNIMLNPMAGLLFIDWLTGDMLQITGTASIDFKDRSLPGAQRAVRFEVQEWIHVRAGCPLRQQPNTEVDCSPYLPRSVSDKPTVTCVAIKAEAKGINSYVFTAPLKDGAILPMQHSAGQYAAFDFEGLEGQGSVTTRTWTISSPVSTSRGNTPQFSISVKRIGLVSGWLADNMKPGKDLSFRGVAGDFVAQPHTPALLLGGGIGITPLRPIMHELIKQNVPVTLLYSVRLAEEAAFLQELEGLAKQASSDAKVVLFVSGKPTVKASGRQRPGRITAADIAAEVPDVKNRLVYICGPDPFMTSMEAAAAELGVPKQSVLQEAFAY